MVQIPRRGASARPPPPTPRAVDEARHKSLLPPASSRTSTVTTRLRAESVQLRYHPRDAQTTPQSTRGRGSSPHTNPAGPVPTPSIRASFLQRGLSPAASTVASRLRSEEVLKRAPSSHDSDLAFLRNGSLSDRPTLTPRTLSQQSSASARGDDLTRLYHEAAPPTHRHAIVHTHWHANEARRSSLSRASSSRRAQHSPSSVCPSETPTYTPNPDASRGALLRDTDAVCLRSELAPAGTLPTMSPHLRYAYPNAGGSPSAPHHHHRMLTAHEIGELRNSIENHPLRGPVDATRMVVVLNAPDSRLPAPLTEEGGTLDAGRCLSTLTRDDSRHLYRHNPAHLAEALEGGAPSSTPPPRPTQFGTAGSLQSVKATLRSVQPISGKGAASPALVAAQLSLTSCGVAGSVDLTNGALTLSFDVSIAVGGDSMTGSFPAVAGTHRFTCAVGDVVTAVPAGAALTVVGPFSYQPPERQGSPTCTQTGLLKVVVELSPAEATAHLAGLLRGGSTSPQQSPCVSRDGMSLSPSAVRPLSESRPAGLPARRATSVTVQTKSGACTPRATAIIAGGPNQSLVQGDHADYDIGLRQYSAAPRLVFSTKRTPEMVEASRRGEAVPSPSPSPQQPLSNAGSAARLRSMRDQRREELYTQLRRLGGG